jgi:hypothetical protein
MDMLSWLLVTEKTLHIKNCYSLFPRDDRSQWKNIMSKILLNKSKQLNTPIGKTLYEYFPVKDHHAVESWILKNSGYDAFYMHLSEMVEGVKEELKIIKLSKKSNTE